MVRLKPDGQSAVIGSGFGDVTDMVFGYDGCLYLSDFAHDRVLRISPPVYDIATDFSTAANPNGVWSFGYEYTLGDSFILYTDQVNLYGLDFWRKDLFSGVPFVPFVAHNPATNTVGTGQVYGPGQAAFHPGPNGEYSIVRFTAPGAGSYQLESLFFGGEKVSGTTIIRPIIGWWEYPTQH